MNNKFETKLSLIITALIDKICKVYHMNEETAAANLMNTKFYTYLKNPETNALQYDIEKLFDIYQQEIELGKIAFLFDNKKI